MSQEEMTVGEKEIAYHMTRAFEDCGQVDWQTVLGAVRIVVRKAISVGASSVDIRQAVEDALYESAG